MKKRDVPVVWSTNMVSDGLTEYDESGYLKKEAFYDSSRIESVCDEVYALREVVDGESIAYEIGSTTARAIYGFHTLVPELVDVLLPPAAVELAEQILGPDVYISQSRINFKNAHGGGGYFWHSDFTIWNWEDGLVLPRCITFMIPLSKISRVNAPLRVTPGSHLYLDEFSSDCEMQDHEGKYKYSPSRDVSGRCRATAAQMDLGNTLSYDSLEGKPGDLFCFDSNIYHSSDVNYSPRSRPVAFIVINSLHNGVRAPVSGQPPRSECWSSKEQICLTTR